MPRAGGVGMMGGLMACLWRQPDLRSTRGAAWSRFSPTSNRRWEPVLQNYLNFETETESRRYEREQEIAAAAQAAQARQQNGRKRWSQLPHLVLARLLSRAVSRVPLRSSWNTATEGRSVPKPWKEAVPL
jgi:hypothetical protein